MANGLQTGNNDKVSESDKFTFSAMMTITKVLAAVIIFVIIYQSLKR